MNAISDVGLAVAPLDKLAEFIWPDTAIENLTLTLVSGGAVVWLLLGFSLLSLTVCLVKLAQLIAWRLRPSDSVDHALTWLSAARVNDAIACVEGQSNPRAKVLKHALDMLKANDHSAQEIKDEAIRRARLGLAQQESHLRVLEVIAMLAPLLGLFGTVLGMIEAFKAMESAGSQVDPSVLSGGIWQALLTTAFGLAVAIPVSIAHSWFERKLEVQAGRLQNDIDVLGASLSRSLQSVTAESSDTSTAL